jgi:hypothetical protein
MGIGHPGKTAEEHRREAEPHAWCVDDDQDESFENVAAVDLPETGNSADKTAASPALFVRRRRLPAGVWAAPMYQPRAVRPGRSAFLD